MYLIFSKLENETDSVHQCYVAEGFSQCHGEERQGYIGAGDAQHDGDDRADDGQECEESHHGAAASHEYLGLFYLLVAHVQVALNPLEREVRADIIVEESAHHIDHRAKGHEFPRTQPHGVECHHDHFAAEGEEATGYEGGDAHAPVAEIDEKRYEKIQFFDGFTILYD